MTQQPADTMQYQGETQTCPNCGMARAEWQNEGRGYEYAGQTYCCQGCAEDTGCTCR